MTMYPKNNDAFPHGNHFTGSMAMQQQTRAAEAVEMRASGPTIFTVLRDDHDRAKELIGRFRRGDEVAYAQLSDALRRHSYGEEQTLYRTLEQVPSMRSVVQANWQEHEALDTILTKLDAMSHMSRAWIPTFNEMVQMLNHHIFGEEGAPGFPGLFDDAATLIPLANQVALAQQYESLVSRPAPRTANPTTIVIDRARPRPKWLKRHRRMPAMVSIQTNPITSKPKLWRHFVGVFGFGKASDPSWYRSIGVATPSTRGKPPYVQVTSPGYGTLHRRGMKPVEVAITNERQLGNMIQVQVAPAHGPSIRSNPDGTCIGQSVEANPMTRARLRRSLRDKMHAAGSTIRGAFRR